MKLILFGFLFLFAVIPAFAQHGGKAEPKRIELTRGKTTTSVSGTLSNDQEMDLVFGARAGQTVTLSVSSAPAGRFFDFRVQGDGFDLPTEYDSYTSYTFKAPETGDYLAFVRKRPTEKVKRGKFTLKFSIK